MDQNVQVVYEDEQMKLVSGGLPAQLRYGECTVEAESSSIKIPFFLFRFFR
jgi:hypothetical protein